MGKNQHARTVEGTEGSCQRQAGAAVENLIYLADHTEHDVALNFAKNAQPRVSGGTCRRCRVAVVKPKRGPTARLCPACRRETDAARRCVYFLRTARSLAMRFGDTALEAQIAAVLAQSVDVHTASVGKAPGEVSRND